uniref:Uncharacterized protein n=1 Tax=Megaselia scalaris TaxID=36166 RepID=T1GR69_MEGSC
MKTKRNFHTGRLLEIVGSIKFSDHETISDLEHSFYPEGIMDGQTGILNFLLTKVCSAPLEGASRPKTGVVFLTGAYIEPVSCEKMPIPVTKRGRSGFCNILNSYQNRINTEIRTECHNT